MYYVSNSLLNPQVYSYIIISLGNDRFLFVYCIPSFISVLFVHLTSLWNYSNKHHLDSIHSKDHSRQGQLNLADALGMIHIWRPWKLSNFQDPPTSLSFYVQYSSTPLTLDIQFQTNPPLQIIINQLKQNIIQGWLLYVTRSFLR